jgi:filamentous hemagglutinin family protein
LRATAVTSILSARAEAPSRNVTGPPISFGVTAGQSATFTGRATVDNIIAGVTGGKPSTIDGTIKSAIRGANLYFINPNGVIFEPRATVNADKAVEQIAADLFAGNDQIIRPGERAAAANRNVLSRSHPGQEPRERRHPTAGGEAKNHVGPPGQCERDRPCKGFEILSSRNTRDTYAREGESYHATDDLRYVRP